MAKFYVKTYGCSLNLSDSETISGLLVGEGHELVENINGTQEVVKRKYVPVNPKITNRSEYFLTRDEIKIMKELVQIPIVGRCLKVIH